MDSKIRWFALEHGDYIEVKPGADGVIRSRIFLGLWPDVRGLRAGDEEKVSRTLERGIESADQSETVRKDCGKSTGVSGSAMMNTTTLRKPRSRRGNDRAIRPLRHGGHWSGQEVDAS